MTGDGPSAAPRQRAGDDGDDDTSSAPASLTPRVASLRSAGRPVPNPDDYSSVRIVSASREPGRRHYMRPGT
jgi:hypothetical protein